MSAPVRGMLWMAVAGVFFAVGIGVTRYLTEGYSVFQIVLLRQGFGFLVLLVWFARRGFIDVRTTQLHLHALRGLGAYTGLTLSVTAITLIAIAEAQAIQFTLPLLTALFASLFLHERISGGRLVGIVVGFAGALVIIRPGLIPFSLGMAAAIGASAAFACNDVLTRYVQGKDRTTVTVFLGLGFQVLIALGPALYVWRTPASGDVLPFLVMAAMSFGSQYCLTRAFAVAEASIVSPVLFIRLPMVAVVGLVFFGEVIDIWTWLGAATIFVSTWYMGRSEARKAAQAA